MPASVNETLTAPLLLSLSSKCGPENGEIPLEQRMAAATKRILHTEIDYEISNDAYLNTVIQELKAKFSDQHDEGSLKNGLMSNSQNAAGKCNTDSSSPILPTPAKVLFPIDKVCMQWSSQRCNQGSGFVNAGNSCYLNSVLQALFHIPPMFNWLMEADQQHQRSCNTYINSTTECIICCMAVTLRQSQQRAGNDMRPHLILARLRSICKRLILGQQEDAMEFLRYLFEAMEKSYLHRFSGMKLDSYSKETTPLNQIFGGYIRTDVTCLHCRGVSTTFQHFLDLALDISRGPSLEHALDIYFSQERLEGDNSYRCEKCRRKVPAAKQFFIERLPNVLCIQLKRFSIEGKKISKCIQLAERINLQRFLSRSKSVAGQQVQRPPRGACYRLQAGVNHHGHTAQSGHYTTVAYASNMNLYHFDDSSVQRVWTGRGFSGTDVYLLMYVLDSKQDNIRPVSTPSSSTTTASQSLQSGPSRSPTKATVAPSFIPLQCRPKPAIQTPNKIIFNTAANSSTGKESLVTPTKCSTELPKSKNLLGTHINNKPSKLINSLIPTNKDGTAAVAIPSKTNVQSPATSPSLLSGKERMLTKAQNGLAQGNLSMPSLVPYAEEHSSGDEAESSVRSKLVDKEAPAAPTTNGWIVTPSKNTTSDKDGENEDSQPDKEKRTTEAPPHLNRQLRFFEQFESPSTVNGVDSCIKKNSPKLGQDIIKRTSKPVINNSETVLVNKSCDAESSSVAESECSVHSTSTPWHVSPVAKSPEKESAHISAHPSVPKAETRSATASWVVTSVPTSAEQSPGALPSTSPSSLPEASNGKQTNNCKRKWSSRRSSNSSNGSSSRSSSSDSSSTTINSKPNKRHKVWVERTKETIFGCKEDKEEKRSGGVKRSASSRESDSRLNVAGELRKFSHAGYGGAQVSTWNGGRNVVERQVREDFYERRRQHKEECDYDSDLDGGRRKKVKSNHLHEKEDGQSRVNRFQQESDYRRNGDHYYDRQNNWGFRKDNFHSGQHNIEHRRNWPSNQQYHHHNNFNYRKYHNYNNKNYKGGNSWGRYPHGKRRHDHYSDSRNRPKNHYNGHRYNHR